MRNGNANSLGRGRFPIVIQTGRLLSLCSLVIGLILTGCAGTANSNLPKGQTAYQAIQAEEIVPADSPYTIGPKDLLNLVVFQEPDLSQEKLRVDGGGNVEIPLIGEVRAAGV